MKAGDYIRTKDGIIDEIVISYNGKCASPNCNKKHVSCRKNYYNEDEITKSSPNIIDLIEVGDYVNRLPVERIKGTLDDENDIRVWFGVATYGRTTLNQINHRYTVKDEFEDDYSLRFRCIKPEDIKSIVTKEQFSQMEYKVGE